MAAPQIPEAATSSASPRAVIKTLPQATTHTVTEGDNLWDLAKHYQTTVEELMQANRLKSDRLRLGQVLQLPGDATIPQASSAHTVRAGDNLWDLARRYRTSIEELMELNRLKTSRLHLGQELLLPAAPAVELPPELRQRLEANAQAGSSNSAALSSENPPTDPLDVILRETSDAASIRSLMQIGIPGLEEDTLPTSVETAPPLTLREQLVIAGFNFLGVRYRWNGTSEKRGFDCSGLVQRLYSLFSIEIPRSSREQFKVGEKIARAALEIGDLVFFSSRGGKTPTHVGIYIGGEQFLHAASRGKKVMISKLTEAWYSRRFIGARRILGLWKDENGIAENKGN